MSTTYLGNAFSLGMLSDTPCGLSIDPVTPADVPADAVSVVGHADTAVLLTGVLGRDVPMNRVSTTLHDGDVLYVAQYAGPRLPEGATSLPEGASFRWLRVTKVTRTGNQRSTT
jgi:hypothetical protein